MENPLKPILTTIIADPDLHAKWLNTLSLMENTGARKIARFEDERYVTDIILKHAAEEFRHAYFLKRQLNKIVPGGFPNYTPDNLLVPVASRHYLHQLDLLICRYLKENTALTGYDYRFAAYLLTTYAIEVRADYIYPIYQDLLLGVNSPVSVRSIIAEEAGHLEAMQKMMDDSLDNWEVHTKAVVQLETAIFDKWVKQLGQVIEATPELTSA